MIKNIVISTIIDAIEEFELLKNSELPGETLKSPDFSSRYKDVLSLILKTLNVTIEEILENKNMLCDLNSEVNKFEKTHEELALMEEKLKNANEEIDNLNKNIEDNTFESYYKIKENEEFVGKLKDHYEDSIHDFQIKETFIKDWEMARLDQMIKVYTNDEESIVKTFQKTQQKNEWEVRVHSEIVAFFNEIIQDTLQNIAMWQDKYNEELQMYNKKITVLKNKKIEQKEKYIKKFQTDRENEMIQYAKLKEAKRLEAEKMLFRNSMATKIEAWWKGVMVRRKLGPYKVKKPKGKPNKDKKK